MIERPIKLYHGSCKDLGNTPVLKPGNSGLLFLTYDLSKAKEFGSKGVYTCNIDTSACPTLETDVNETVSQSNAVKSLAVLMGYDDAADYVNEVWDFACGKLIGDPNEPDAEDGYIRLYNLIQFVSGFGERLKEAGHTCYRFTEDGSPCFATTEPVQATRLKTVVESSAKAIIDQAASMTEKPSPNQIKSGDYAKGKFKYNGLTIVIETPKGVERAGTDKDGKHWSVILPAHYGYVDRTEGKDGDEVDVYIGDNPESDKVFIVNQNKLEGGFDEHKCVLGCDNLAQAIEIYDGAFTGDLGKKLRGKVHQVGFSTFKKWAISNKTKAPYVQEAAPVVILAYHGTCSKFKKFNPRKSYRFPMYRNLEMPGDAAKVETLEHGISWFTPDASLAKEYAKERAEGYEDMHDKKAKPVVIAAKLTFTNPKYIDCKGREWDSFGGLTIDDLAIDAKKRGHDGVIFTNVVDAPGGLGVKSTSIAVINLGCISIVNDNYATIKEATVPSKGKHYWIHPDVSSLNGTTGQFIMAPDVKVYAVDSHEEAFDEISDKIGCQSWETGYVRMVLESNANGYTLYYDGVATPRQERELKNIAIENRFTLTRDEISGKETVVYSPVNEDYDPDLAEISPEEVASSDGEYYVDTANGLVPLTKKLFTSILGSLYYGGAFAPSPSFYIFVGENKRVARVVCPSDSYRFVEIRTPIDRHSFDTYEELLDLLDRIVVLENVSAKQIVNSLLEDYDPDLAEVSPEEIAVASGRTSVLERALQLFMGDAIGLEFNVDMREGVASVNVYDGDFEAPDFADGEFEWEENLNKFFADWTNNVVSRLIDDQRRQEQGDISDSEAEHWMEEDDSVIGPRFDVAGDLVTAGDRNIVGYNYSELSANAKKNAIGNWFSVEENQDRITQVMQANYDAMAEKWNDSLKAVGFTLDHDGLSELGCVGYANPGVFLPYAIKHENFNRPGDYFLEHLGEALT